MNGEICLNMRITFESTQNKNTQPTNFTIFSNYKCFLFSTLGYFLHYDYFMRSSFFSIINFPLRFVWICVWMYTISCFFSSFFLALSLFLFCCFFFYFIWFLCISFFAYFRVWKINHPTSMRVLIVFLDIILSMWMNIRYSRKKNCFEWQIPFNGIDKNCNYNHQQCQKESKFKLNLFVNS